jgi:hypothetical protein
MVMVRVGGGKSTKNKTEGIEHPTDTTDIIFESRMVRTIAIPSRSCKTGGRTDHTKATRPAPTPHDDARRVFGNNHLLTAPAKATHAAAKPAFETDDFIDTPPRATIDVRLFIHTQNEIIKVDFQQHHITRIQGWR